MYLQLTTRCDMACPHCCFACRPGVGKDMDEATFIAACELAFSRGESIGLGGGEPLLHPKFWQFFGIALRYSDESPPFIATNGSQTADAIRLAELTKKGACYAVLSQDEFHDPIDPRVVRIFKRLHESGEHEGIRNNAGNITAHGSALVNKLFTRGRDECCCEDPLVYPDGKLFGCGCRKVRFGTVFAPEIPEDFEYGTCAVKWKKERCQTTP